MTVDAEILLFTNRFVRKALIAKELGVSRQTVGTWMRSERPIRPIYLAAIMSILKAELREIELQYGRFVELKLAGEI